MLSNNEKINILVDRIQDLDLYIESVAANPSIITDSEALKKDPKIAYVTIEKLNTRRQALANELANITVTIDGQL